MRLADRIRKAVDAAALRGVVLTQSGLAKACGISRASVHAWFHGDTDSIDGKYLTTAAAYLGVNPHWLGTGAGDMLNQVGQASSIPPVTKFGTPTATQTDPPLVIPQYAVGGGMGRRYVVNIELPRPLLDPLTPWTGGRPFVVVDQPDGIRVRIVRH